MTDPPYGVEYDPGWRNKAGAAATKRTGKVMNDDRADWREAWALFPGDVAYVWHGALHATTVADSLIASGFNIRSQIIWAKDRLVLTRALSLVFRLARQERDVWVNWPARAAALMAADLGVESAAMQKVLEKHVRAQLDDLAEVYPDLR